MPDWTYQPLRGIAAALLGTSRSRRWALRTLAAVGSLPGGGKCIARGLGHRHPPPEHVGFAAGVAVRPRLGAVVPPGMARDAVRALPPLGAGLVVISPVGPADVAAVRAAAAGRRVPVLACVSDTATAGTAATAATAPPAPGMATAAALSPHVDAVLTDLDAFHLASGPVATAARVLADSDRVVLVPPAVLVRDGPGWFARVTDAATRTAQRAGLREVGLDPRRWPSWWWGTLVGFGMIVAGLGAAAITLGPVLLWYDRAYLGGGTEHLHGVNHHLVHFLQHDRITMAGALVAIGVLYVGLAAGGIRRGWPWARDAYLASGWVGFSTVLYFLGSGFVEPLQALGTVILFPMFLAATLRRPTSPRWTTWPEGPDRERRRALVGQLLMVITGLGLLIGGAAVSVVGLTDVFVGSDLAYLRATAGSLDAANPRLLGFIAHDRAGFGGALMAAATAITLISAWAWRRGEAWVWWTLAVAATVGFLPAIAVHAAIGYNALGHLAPVHLGLGLTVTALGLARGYLCAAAAG